MTGFGGGNGGCLGVGLGSSEGGTQSAVRGSGKGL